MRTRSLVVLFAAAALLTAYYAVFERDPLVVKIGPVFKDLAFGDVVEIELIPGPGAAAVGASAAPILLRKEGDGWMIDTPRFPARLPRVESIAWSLIDLQRIADLADPDTPGTFDPRGPEVTVRFRTRSGEAHQVEVGKDHPEAKLELCYARVDGKRLFLARRAFKKTALTDLDDVRSRALFPISRDRALRLAVAGSEPAAKSAHREGAVDWRFDSPDPAPASRELMGGLLDDLNSWQAESFVRDAEGDLAPFGLDRPRLSISLSDQERTVTLLIGKAAPEKGQVYVKWSGQPFIMTAKQEPADRLERPAEELYSKYVLQLGASDVAEVTVAPASGAAGGRFTLRRKGKTGPKAGGRGEDPGAAWELEEAPGSRAMADTDRARMFVDDLRFLLVKRYVLRTGPDAASAESDPLATVEIGTETGGRKSLLFGRPRDPSIGDDVLAVTVDDEPFIHLVVSRTLQEVFRRGPVQFRNRRFSTLEPEDIREVVITLRDAGEERTWTLGRPQSTWELPDTGEYTLIEGKYDASVARRAVEALGKATFRAEDWVDPAPDPAAVEVDDSGFRIRVSITYLEDDGEYHGFRNVWLGAQKTAGTVVVGRWARVDAPGLEKTPFVLERSVSQAIADLADHLKGATRPVSR